MTVGRARIVALSLSAALALVYLAWAPQTLDLSAQTYRADLWDAHGFVLWDPAWYSGLSVPGYSLIYPPLGALLGPVLVGALSAVAATALFAAVALRAFGERAWLGVVLFGLGSLAAPFAGRTTFALGLAIALAAVLAVQRSRSTWAALAALAAACTSPVAGLFTGLVCAAVVLASRGRPEAGLPVRAALAGAAGAAVGVGALALAFPTPGFQPFAFSAWIWIPLASLAIFLLAHWGSERSSTVVLVFGWATLLYVIGGTAALVIETPLGSNAVRFGATFAAPLAAILLMQNGSPPRPRSLPLLLVLVLPLLWWQWTGTVRDVAVAGDSWTGSSYFAPLLAMPAFRDAPPQPIRISPTRSRWESVYVAERRPISGGWLRQIEAPDKSFLTDGPLRRREYVDWLAGQGIGLVAVSDAEPDWFGTEEQKLFDRGAFDADLVGEAGGWRLYRIGKGSFVASGPARLVALEPDRFGLRIGPHAQADLHLRFSPYFQVTGGIGCVQRVAGPDGEDMTRVTSGSDRAQVLTVEARFSLAGALGRDRDCSG